MAQSSGKPQGISQKVAIGDPDNPGNVVKPNADGSINVVGGGGGTVTATATVAAPAYVEGTNDNLSQDLSGNLRTLDTGVLAALQTPATELPPPVPVASNNTTLTRAVVSISSAGTTPIVGATTSQSTRVHRITLTIAGANTLTFKSAITSLGAFTFPSTGGILVLDFSPYWWFKTADNEAFQITTSGTPAVEGIIDYVKGA